MDAMQLQRLKPEKEKGDQTGGNKDGIEVHFLEGKQFCFMGGRVDILLTVGLT